MDHGTCALYDIRRGDDLNYFLRDRQIKLFTIGFTKKTAEEFFSRLLKAGVKRVIDIRLNNVSQLAGFAKRDDLRYFLRAIGQMDYVHRPDLAPSCGFIDFFTPRCECRIHFKNLINTFLVRGPSNSQKKMDCQAPRTRRPFSTMTISEAPTSDDLTCAAELPSECR